MVLGIRPAMAIFPEIPRRVQRTSQGIELTNRQNKNKMRSYRTTFFDRNQGVLFTYNQMA